MKERAQADAKTWSRQRGSHPLIPFSEIWATLCPFLFAARNVKRCDAVSSVIGFGLIGGYYVLELYVRDV